MNFILLKKKKKINRILFFNGANTLLNDQNQSRMFISVKTLRIKFKITHSVSSKMAHYLIQIIFIQIEDNCLIRKGKKQINVTKYIFHM